MYPFSICQHFFYKRFQIALTSFFPLLFCAQAGLTSTLIFIALTLRLPLRYSA